MAIEFRTVQDGELDAYREQIWSSFGQDLESDPGGGERLRALLDRSQVWAAVDGGAIVGTAGTHMLELVVPGGTLPMAGLTIVTVRPTHRRRGILRELMRIHVDDAERRALPVSGLWASEASIYGRFGYGMAAEADVVKVEHASTLALEPRELDALEPIDERRARELLPAIYARATANRPGALVRSPMWWRERRFLETPFIRGGASLRRHVVAKRGDDLVGYVVYRQRPDWTGGLPTGKTEVVELLAIDTRATATLWTYVLTIDLFPTVTWWNTPPDDPLVWLAGDPRRVQRRRVDSLWLRVGDVPRTLEARRYEHDGALRLRVDDATWDLTVADGQARCTPTTRAPELALSRAALGSLYLGGVTASRLARAERVTGDAAAIARADRMFAWPLAAWCPEVF